MSAKMLGFGEKPMTSITVDGLRDRYYPRDVYDRFSALTRVAELAQPHHSVLEIGCGDGRRSPDLRGRVRMYAGFDPDPRAGANLKPGHVHIGKAELLPWPDATFDIVLHFMVAALEVTTDGAPRTFVRTAVPLRSLLGKPGDVDLHRAYVSVFKGDGAGLVLTLWGDVGNIVRRATGPAAPLLGESPIRFGAWHVESALGAPPRRPRSAGRTRAPGHSGHRGATGDNPAPPKQVVFEDPFGWLPDPVPAGGSVQGSTRSVHRFSRAQAPDGTMAVRHQIRQGEIVDTLAHDSRVFRPAPGYKSVTLTFKAWWGAHRNQPGKYVSLMGGRGQAGAQYQRHYSEEKTGPEGWSFYMTTGGSKNDPRAPIGPANRSELGAICTPKTGKHLDSEGGDPVGGNKQMCYEPPLKFSPSFSVPLGRWVDIEFRVEMNKPGQSDGAARFTFDTKTVSKSGVMWAMDPLASPELYLRWRMMYGGTPSKLKAPNEAVEYYKDFKIVVKY